MRWSFSLVGSKLSQAQSKGATHSLSAREMSTKSFSKYGCSRQCLTVYLFSGLNTSIFCNRL